VSEYDLRLNELKELASDLEASNRSHPFVLETLADYTDDTSEAIALYRRALDLSKSFPAEPLHTKHIALATRLIELSQVEEAREHITIGMSLARDAGDASAIEEAANLARSTVA
jgi:tetratricopeptide (TPR) repeat protein